MRRALLLHNVTAGRHETPAIVTGVSAALAEEGWEVEACGVDRAEAGTEAVRKALKRGVDAVFAVGGDGTVRDAATGLYGSPVPLGVIPAGTTNVVARALRVPLDALAAAHALGAGRTATMDVGLCDDRPFLMQATAGFDASVIARIDRRLKARFGRLSIALQGLGQWWRYHYPELELSVDGRPTTARQVAVCNIPEYGGDFRIVSGGRFDDRRLDVVLFRGKGRRATLSFFVDIGRGVHEGRPDVEVCTADSVELLGPAGVDVQIDGDPIAAAVPLAMRLAPEPLCLLVPA